MADDPATRLWNVDEEEGDLCRVCRSEAEDSKPLIYPCKCSGSVRYVHSDCLQEWLSHSKKRYCEICGHHYTFTKVYPSTLPSAIPMIVYVRQSLFVAGRIAWRIFRICLAIVSWLVLLPCITMASLRIILASVDYLISPSLSYGVENAILDSFEDLNSTLSTLPNITDTNATGRDRVLAVIATNSSIYEILPSLTSKMADDAKHSMAFVFRGQIVAVSIAAGLVGLILLREWIGQLDWNTRPVEEEEQLNPDDWVFRNGQAMRVTDFAAAETSTAEATAAGDTDRAADFGDTETVVEGPGEGQEVDGMPEPARRPSASLVAFVAPEQLEDETPRLPAVDLNDEVDLNELPEDLNEFVLAADQAAEELYGEGGNRRDARASWPPDVPTDAVPSEGGDPGPATRLAWLRDASVPETVDMSELSEDSHQEEPSHDGSYQASGETSPGSPPQPHNGHPDPFDDDDQRDHAAQQAQLMRDLERMLAVDTPTPTANRQPVPPLDSESESETVHDPSALLMMPPLELVRTDTELEDLDTDADQEGDGDGEADGDGEPDIAQPQVNAMQLLDHHADVIGELDGMGMELPPDDEEDRPLDADDWDGIFEVVGFIGPLTGLVHNHIFVSFAMACTLVILVGLPVMIGKLFLLWADVRAIHDVLFGTIHLIGFLLDTTIAVVTNVVRHALIVPRKIAEPAVEWVASAVGIPHFDLNPIGIANRIFGHSEIIPTTVTEIPPMEGLTGKMLDVFELLGGLCYAGYKSIRLFCVCVAGSPDVLDQFLSLVVGYACLMTSVVAIAIADAANLLQLSELVVEKARSVAMFLKVVFFMMLEIVLFPLFVGLVMDASTLLLFGHTLGDRVHRLALRPFGTLFIAWLTGTIFMFSFATFLAHLRTICRRGALYFIRDPSDPSHSPVKDIMERPVMAQLPRLASSAVMYSIIAFSVCGAVPSLLAGLSYIGILSKSFLPLRLDQRPLSSVPFDLLFLHLVLPPSWENLRVYHRLKKGLHAWWIFTIRWLELSSLILGVETTGGPQGKMSQLSWRVTDTVCQWVFGRYNNRATRARVPGNDRIELLPLTGGRREGMFIPLDDKGAPLNKADELRLLRQDNAARRAQRNPLKDYTVVNLPEYWRTRIHVLLGAGLVSSALLVATIFFIPLAVGRLTTAFLFNVCVFDGYSWLAGLYVCWGSVLLGQNLRRRLIRYSRAGRLRRSGTSTRLKRGVMGFLTTIYSLGVLYFILPMLVGINFELFISLPARYGFSNDLTPVLHLWDAWAMGTGLISLYVGAIGYLGHEAVQDPRPGHEFRAQRFREAFRRPLRQNFRSLNRSFLPLALAMLVPIVVPWMLLLGICMYLKLIGVPLPNVDNSWAFRMMYPVTLVVILLTVTWKKLSDMAGSARQWIFDAEYVIEERVENYEPDEDEDDEKSKDEEWEDVEEHNVLAVRELDDEHHDLVQEREAVHLWQEAEAEA